LSALPDGIFSRFWTAYGGRKAVLRSRYFQAAIFLTPLCWGSWSVPLWWDTVISVLPNLLGFTLGGFAIFVGFGDEKFKASLATPEADSTQPTVYREFCATFVHFIFVQVIALLLAVVSKGLWFKASFPKQILDLLPALNGICGAICYMMFLYALTSVVAIGFHVFRIATMYETHQRYISAADPDTPREEPAAQPRPPAAQAQSAPPWMAPPMTPRK
jgi:hypothetical protein